MWSVEFDAPNGPRHVVKMSRGPHGARPAVDVFLVMLKTAIQLKGCKGFRVTVHPDGPDCDHEVPPR